MRQFIDGEALDKDGVPTAAKGFVDDGVFIVNARLSDCGRFAVRPSVYGLTDEEADELAALNIPRNLEAFD